MRKFFLILPLGVLLLPVLALGKNLNCPNCRVSNTPYYTSGVNPLNGAGTNNEKTVQDTINVANFLLTARGMGQSSLVNAYDPHRDPARKNEFNKRIFFDLRKNTKNRPPVNWDGFFGVPNPFDAASVDPVFRTEFYHPQKGLLIGHPKAPWHVTPMPMFGSAPIMGEPWIWI